MTTDKPHIRHEDAIIHAQQCAEAYTDACTAVREAFEELERAVGQVIPAFGSVNDLVSEMTSERTTLDRLMPERIASELDIVRRWNESRL